jgi:hypothetical protein
MTSSNFEHILTPSSAIVTFIITEAFVLLSQNCSPPKTVTLFMGKNFQ